MLVERLARRRARLEAVAVVADLDDERSGVELVEDLHAVPGRPA